MAKSKESQRPRETCFAYLITKEKTEKYSEGFQKTAA